MRRMCFSLLAAVLTLSAGSVSADTPALDTEEKKTLYALGLAMSQRLKNLALTTDEVNVIQGGFGDGLLNRPAPVTLDEYGPKIDAFVRGKLAAVAARRKEEGSAFRAKAEQEPGAVKTDSGMLYFEQTPGSGAAPSKAATVKLHYHGTLTDGTVFDSSRQGEPATFPLNGVVPCFAEGIGRMKVGGKSKLICPPELAYGDQGAGPSILPGSTLVFEIELLEVTEPAAAAPPAP